MISRLQRSLLVQGDLIVSLATKTRVALPLPRTDTKSLNTAMIERSSDAFTAAGAGLAIGSLFGVLAGRSERETIAGGITGGITGGMLGLLLESISNGEQPATSDLAKAVRRGWGLTQGVFARLVGYSPRSVASYEITSMLTPTVARRYVEIGRLRQTLEGVMNSSSIDGWLETSNTAFDGSTPIELIERGEIDRIWTAIYDVAYGMS